MLKSQYIYNAYLVLASLYWIVAVVLGQGEPRLLFFGILGFSALYLTVRRPWYYWTRALTAATLFGNIILFSFQTYVFSNFVGIGIYLWGGALLSLTTLGLLSSISLFLHTLLGTYRTK